VGTKVRSLFERDLRANAFGVCRVCRTAKTGSHFRRNKRKVCAEITLWAALYRQKWRIKASEPPISAAGPTFATVWISAISAKRTSGLLCLRERYAFAQITP